MKMLIAAQIVKKLSALPTEEYADIWQAMYDAAPKSTPPPAIEVIPKLGEAMEVLRELVVLEDLGRAMAKAFSPRPRDPKYILTDDELTKYSDLCAENARRKPLAWAAARAILAAPIAPKESS